MRESIFRGKRMDNSEWVKGSLYQDYDCPECASIIPVGSLEWREGDRFSITAFDVDPATVGQYTGLEDKNGVDIYEGDILRATGDGILAASNQTSLFGVKWNEKEACFVFIRPNYEQLEGFNVIYDMATNMIFKICEVVGNIHENPELLGAEI